MKIKRIFLSFILVLSLVCFSACKKKTDDDTTTPAKTSPTVTVSVLNTKVYIGDVLSSVELVTETTDTPGVVTWDNPTYAFVAGDNVCAWTFTPTDTATYSTKSGSITLTAVERPVEPEIIVSIADGTYYEGQKLSNVPLEYTPSDISGTLSWVNPNQVLTLGENECLWRFIPTDQERFATIMDMITIETSSQYLSAITVKVNPTKMTGYEYLDEFDDTGMILELVYNAGRRVELTEGWTISYPESRDYLVAGNNLMTISYAGKTCTLNVRDVAKLEVDEPTFVTKTYNGSAQTVEVATNASANFTYDTATTYTNANPSGYQISVSLVDENNYKWKNNEGKTIVVPFVINKTNLTFVEHDYTADYDGEEHAAYVETTGECTIYYAEESLNQSNYDTVGDTELIKFTDVIEDKVIYYYIVSQNYFDVSGDLVVNIRPQTGAFTLPYCYTIETGEPVEYPREYITLKDAAGNTLPTDEVALTYYISYSNTTLTSFSNSGAETKGGAPADKSNVPYEVHVVYTSKNIVAEAIAFLFIDNPKSDFYAAAGQSAFAFKADPVEYGSTELCEYYVEFKPETNETTGLLEIKYNIKLGKGTNKNSTGVLINEQGTYKLVDDNGSKYTITSYKNKGGDDENPDSVTITELDLTLEKWIIPDYLGTFALQSIPDEETTYEEKNSYITLYNDHGTIRFIFEYNLVKVDLTDGEYKGGHDIFYGIAEYELISDYGWKHNLYCYVAPESAEYYTAGTKVSFVINWWTTNIDDSVCVNPQDFVVIEKNNGLEDIVGFGMSSALVGELTYTDPINPFVKVEE